MIVFLGIIFVITLFSLVVGLVNQNSLPLPTASGAIIMSAGIIVNGSFQQVPFFRDKIGPYEVISLVILGCLFIYQYSRDGMNGGFKEQHLKHPVASFGIGTWVAAISVTILSIIRETPSAKLLAYMLFLGNIPLWVAYLVVIVRNYQRFWIDRIWKTDLLDEVNGVVLLACVATQSIVMTGCVIWPNLVPSILWNLLVLLGITFYIVGMYFIIRRYRFVKCINLAEEWTNTNCIIHGALSITGLSLSIGHLVSPNWIVTLWMVVFMLFIIVESIEILRFIQLQKRDGWKKGIFTYSVTQWSRNFTFGMFDAFTYKLPLSESYLKHEFLFVGVQNLLILYWKYVVLALFLVQVVLFQLDYLEKGKKQKNQVRSNFG